MAMKAYSMGCTHDDEVATALEFTETQAYPGRKAVVGNIRIKLFQADWNYAASDPVGIALMRATVQIQNVLLDFDILLLARTLYEPNGSYANAAACSIRGVQPHLPTIGRIAWNRNQVTNTHTAAGFQSNLRVMEHEIMHVLAFSSILYQFWGVSPVTQTHGKLNYMVTPGVVKEARDYYGCPTAIGMLLEDAGGQGSAGSHWEEEILMEELMTPTFTFKETSFMSRMTLALFKDTKWFENVDMSFNEDKYMTFGRNRGCSFITNRDCSIRPEFCEGQDAITYSHRGYGYCIRNPFMQCVGNRNITCTDGANVSLRQVFNGWLACPASVNAFCKQNMLCPPDLCDSKYMCLNGECFDRCTPGKYYVTFIKRCSQCDYSCLTCSDEWACRTCVEGYHPVSYDICIKCEGGQTYNSRT
ncbi:unnamed protein product [Arctogadus glacialis]